MKGLNLNMLLYC